MGSKALKLLKIHGPIGTWCCEFVCFSICWIFRALYLSRWIFSQRDSGTGRIRWPCLWMVVDDMLITSMKLLDHRVDGSEIRRSPVDMVNVP